MAKNKKEIFSSSLAIFRCIMTWFVSDLVGNPEGVPRRSSYSILNNKKFNYILGNTAIVLQFKNPKNNPVFLNRLGWPRPDYSSAIKCHFPINSNYEFHKTHTLKQTNPTDETL